MVDVLKAPDFMSEFLRNFKENRKETVIFTMTYGDLAKSCQFIDILIMERFNFEHAWVLKRSILIL